MAVKIRLSRIGKKKAPFYRVIVIDSRKKRDGQSLEDLGTYNALTGEIVRLEQERLEYWLSKGAVPTGAALKIHKLFKKGSSKAQAV